MQEITQEYLKKLYLYHGDTGTLINRYSRGRAIKDRCAGTQHYSGYIQVHLSYKIYRVHRLIWFMEYGCWPEGEIDHINGVRSDNRLFNLRDVTGAENHKNMHLPKNNSSGAVGVSWCNSQKKWRSYIKIESRQKSLGSFDSKFDAICARKSAEYKYNFHPNHGRDNG